MAGDRAILSIAFLSTRLTADRWIGTLKELLYPSAADMVEYRVYEIIKPKAIQREIARLESRDLKRYGFMGFTSKSAINIVFSREGLRSRILDLYSYGTLFFSTGSGSWSLLRKYGIESLHPNTENTEALIEIICRSSRPRANIAVVSSTHIDLGGPWCVHVNIDQYKVYKLEPDKDRVEDLRHFLRQDSERVKIIVIPSLTAANIFLDTIYSAIDKYGLQNTILYLLSERIYRGSRHKLKYIDNVGIVVSKSPNTNSFLVELASFIKKIIDRRAKPHKSTG